MTENAPLPKEVHVSVETTVDASLFDIWRNHTSNLLNWFNEKRKGGRVFYVKVFLIFALINLACFWWALLTAYPGHIASYKWKEFAAMGFPVALMGAVFDSFSLAVTLYIVKRALAAKNNGRYLAYLSVDLVIAVLAGLWVLFAFIVSGWLVSAVLQIPETFGSRTSLYQGRLWSALLNPFEGDNFRNIYFGIVMGASALLPTLCHLFLAARAFGRWAAQRLVPAAH